MARLLCHIGKKKIDLKKKKEKKRRKKDVVERRRPNQREGRKPPPTNKQINKQNRNKRVKKPTTSLLFRLRMITYNMVTTTATRSSSQIKQDLKLKSKFILSSSLPSSPARVGSGGRGGGSDVRGIKSGWVISRGQFFFKMPIRFTRWFVYYNFII